MKQKLVIEYLEKADKLLEEAVSEMARVINWPGQDEAMKIAQNATESIKRLHDIFLNGDVKVGNNDMDKKNNIEFLKEIIDISQSLAMLMQRAPGALFKKALDVSLSFNRLFARQHDDDKIISEEIGRAIPLLDEIMESIEFDESMREEFREAYNEAEYLSMRLLTYNAGPVVSW